MTRYLSLAEFWYLAEYVTGIDANTLIRASRVDLARGDSHVLACRIAPHPPFRETDRSRWGLATGLRFQGMGGEPTPNAVWKLLDRELGLGDGCGLGVMDAGWVEQRLRPVCTPDFVYERRRRLDTGLPPLDRDAYLQIMSDMIDIMGQSRSRLRSWRFAVSVSS